MIKILRRLIFFAFLAVFLVGAPKIIFYALGYSYRLGADKGLVKTGLIYLSTTPPGASIYVSGHRYHEPTPAIIRDLLPGNYPVRLNLKDHEVWTRNIIVEAAKASVLGKILLYSKKPDWRLRSSGRFEDFIAIPETRYMLLRGSKELSTIQVYDWKDKKTTPLFVENEIQGMRLLQVYFVASSTRILIKAEKSGSTRWIWIDLSKEGKSRMIWVEQLPDESEKIIWSDKEPRYLFVLWKKILHRLDTEEMRLTPFVDKVRGYGLSDKKFFVLSEENHFFSTDFLGNTRKSLSKDLTSVKALFGERGFFEIQPLANNSLFFLGEDGRLASNQKNSPLVEKGVLGFHFDKKNHKAVIWKKDAIGVVEFLKEKKTKVEWVLRRAENIQQAFWAHDGSYIIFQDKNKVYILGLEAFGDPSLYELLETRSGSQIFYTDDIGELFYLDKKTGSLMSLEVVPKWKVLEIPFSILQEKEGKYLV